MELGNIMLCEVTKSHEKQCTFSDSVVPCSKSSYVSI